MSQAKFGLIADRLAKIHPDSGVVSVLAAHDFTSAMSIASTAPRTFIDAVAPGLGGDRKLAETLYNRSTQIRSGVMHAWANVRTALRSPHYKTLRAFNIGPELQQAFEQLPDYEELFGSLNYCSCDECRSIFGAAAYLVDLLRVIDAYVTVPNSNPPIPTAMQFATRRGDIGQIPLTCANTNDTFPLLRIVNERLGALARTYLGLQPTDDLFAALTAVTFPFGLPFNLQAERIPLALSQVGVALSEVYLTFGATPADTARAAFAMSPQYFAFVTTALASDSAGLAAAYGVAEAGLATLSDAGAFEIATGLDVVGLMTLLAQGLGKAEITAGVAAGFFINAGLSGQWLTYNLGDAKNPPSIAGLGSNPNDPLDRLNRFVRLAQQLDWTFEDLDWALRIVGATEADVTSGQLPAADFSAASLAGLARAVRLAGTAGLDLPTFLSLLGPIKPYGAGDGDVSTAPFDVMFNGPGSSTAAVPYHPTTPLNPLYQTTPSPWIVGGPAAADQTLAVFIAAGLGVSQAVLTGLATALWGAGATVQLTLETLSALNRHAIMMATLGVSLGDYQRLMNRLGFVAQSQLQPVFKLADLERIFIAAQWLPSCGLTIDQIDYALGADAPPTVDPLFQAATLGAWLATLQQTTASLAANAGDPAGLKALDQALFGQLAALFGASTDLIEAIHPLVIAAAPPPTPPATWEAAFTTAPTVVGAPPPYLAYVQSYITALSRWLVIVNGLSLPSALVASIAGNPAAYGLATTLTPTIDALYWIAGLQTLVNRYGDSAGRLMAFVDPTGAAPDLPKLLVAATGWDLGQTTALLAPFASSTNRVEVATQVAAQIAMLGRIGCDAALPGKLIAELADAKTFWSDLTALADLTLATVKGRISATQWPSLSSQIEGAIAARQRSVLAPYVLSQLRVAIPSITTLRNVSEYLLTDVEVSGVLQISYIREALNAAQLYLQRCRLKLEPIQVLDIPEIWWEWLMDYRVWEANREVFLYPENYIDPTLRKSATPLFEDLENKLLQDEVTTDRVESVYRSYIEGLIELTGLEYVDAYHCTVDDPERGAVDTSYYFARTTTDPYTFQMISYDTGVWSSWQKISVTIPAALITPVYVFKRLYVFWVELKRTKDSAAQGTASTPQGVTYQATIKCTFADSNSDWIQPQVVVQDQVVYYMPSADNQQGALGPWQSRPDLFQMDDLFWNKVSLTVIDPGGTVAEQRLVLVYGPLVAGAQGGLGLTPPPVPAPQINVTSSDITFAQQIFNFTNSFNELQTSNVDAYLPMVGALVLDRELNSSFLRRANELVIFERDLRENAPPLFRPELETLFGTLMLSTSDCAYRDNYLADFTPHVATVRPPGTVSATSFQTDTIDAPTSQSIFTDLVGNKVVINVVSGSGAVSPSFGAHSDLSFLFGGVPSAQTDPYIPQVRTILLGLAGDPTIIANAPVTTSRTISIKNQPGSFMFSTGDETFLFSPADVVYAEITAATSVAVPLSSPYVYTEFFKSVDPVNFQTIFNDLVGNNIIVSPSPAPPAVPVLGQLDPLFSTNTPLTFLFTGAPLAQQAAMINQVRRILLNLPTLTMLSYQGDEIPRFVLPTSFITADINAAGSRSVYNDLIGNNIIDANGVLLSEVSATTDLSFLFGGSPEPALLAEVRAVLLQLPKFVQPNSFVSTDPTAPIVLADSQAAFAALVQLTVIDPQGLIAIGFGPATDLSSLFPTAQAPQRDLMIASVRTVLLHFYASVYRTDVNEMRFTTQRLSARTSAHELNYTLRGGGIDALLSLDTQNAPVVPKAPFNRLQPAGPPTLLPPTLLDAAQIDFDGPYGLYYWELFFHTPMLVSGALAQNQQFSDAKNWLEYILNPTVSESFVQTQSFVTPDINPTVSTSVYQALLAAGFLADSGLGGARVTAAYTGPTGLPNLFPTIGDPTLHALMTQEVVNVLGNFQIATPQSHYWRFRPFRNYTLETLIAILTDPTQIATYNNDPFDPHAIARLRIGAYEKTIVMKYIDILIAWGDMLFTQFTWESITSATLLYMYAEDLLGPAPKDLGPCPLPDTLNFDQIKALNPAGIPQFLIALEDMLPPPAISPFRMEAGPFNALDAYFCVPENTQLESYWSTVADRLTKIRNGMNINGVPETLALWDPPIDPMALVRLAASGAAVLSTAATTSPAIRSDYRFAPLFDQATKLASMVTEFGAALLAALEKQDADALDRLRSTQETAILNLTTGIKQKAIDELNTSIAGLTLSRARAQFQADYYNTLHTSGLSSQEHTTAKLQFEAMYFSAFSGPIHGISIAGYLAPSIFGLSDGGMKWGDAVNTGAQIADSIANTFNLAAAMTATQGEFSRRDDDWVYQGQLATRDTAILDNQIAAANVQLASAELDYALNQRSIEQSSATTRFLTSKFTSTELYQWMVGRIATLYFQTYTMALDAARKAELAYQYELNATQTFVGFTYWDSLHKGLMAGETLSYSLAQMQKAYTDQRTRVLEVEKTISLLQLDPLQVLQLKAGQPCTISLTETLFDLDFPGHYQRQIASIAITIPALIGPYQNLNATLIQQTSNVVMVADKAIVEYLVKCDQGHPPATIPAGLRQNWKATQEIAISRGVNDSGMFALNFGGDLFMPFEGTGAVSTWTLAIPPENNRIDLSQITDVIISLKYTALDGGSTFDGSPSFRTDVISVLRDNKVRFTDMLYLDAQSMFASSWYAFLNPQAGAAAQTLNFTVNAAMFPYLPTIQLDAVSVRLILASGVTLPATNAFTTLAIGTLSDPLTFALADPPVANAPSVYIAADGRTKIPGAAFLAPWTLTITLADGVPPALLKNGVLDPAVVLGVEFLLSYSADVLPPPPK